MTSPLVIFLIMLAVNAATIIYAQNAWSTAESLHQVIVNSPKVCEICSRKATFMEHSPTEYHQALHNAEAGTTTAELVIIENHEYVPAYLVYTPGILGIIRALGSDSPQ